ncbi:hypothetical protein ACQ7DA_09950 [Zafaria sp. J156]|uniref:hypothetical protein n=1 Tax=Zafaria sp. J156 TaxID=3116490 RepID=UPI002E764ABB|nr:hypothetical protein [Zafaria sp. J156]MEE1621850.1 hypothetical protein [Zafaria sp. J156]
MTDHVLFLIVYAALGLGGFAAFMTACVRSYRGAYRSWMLTRPPLLPVGRHWGLLPLGTAAVTLLLAGGALFAEQLMRYSPRPAEFGAGVAAAVVVLGVVLSLVFSHRLPERWKPGWYRDWEARGADRADISAWLVRRRTGPRDRRDTSENGQ